MINNPLLYMERCPKTFEAGATAALNMIECAIQEGVTPEAAVKQARQDMEFLAQSEPAEA